MNRTLARSLLSVCITLLVCTAGPVAADSADTFRASLVRALHAHDLRAVHAMIAFPVRVMMPGLDQPLVVQTANTFTGAAYGAFFTPDTICAIERSPIRDDGDTVTIGKDVLVARRTGGPLKVAEFRVIGPPAESSRGVRSTLDLRFRGATRQVAGDLAFDDVDAYTVSVTKGVVLNGRLERFQGLDAVFRVTDSTGKVVDAKADGKRTWSASVPTSADYRVEIVRKAPYCDPPITYLLTLTTR